MTEMQLIHQKLTTSKLIKLWYAIDEGFDGEGHYFVHEELLRRGFKHVRDENKNGFMIPPHYSLDEYSHGRKDGLQSS